MGEVEEKGKSRRRFVSSARRKAEINCDREHNFWMKNSRGSEGDRGSQRHSPASQRPNSALPSTSSHRQNTNVNSPTFSHSSHIHQLFPTDTSAASFYFLAEKMFSVYDDQWWRKWGKAKRVWRSRAVRFGFSAEPAQGLPKLSLSLQENFTVGCPWRWQFEMCAAPRMLIVACGRRSSCLLITFQPSSNFFQMTQEDSHRRFMTDDDARIFHEKTASNSRNRAKTNKRRTVN